MTYEERLAQAKARKREYARRYRERNGDKVKESRANSYRKYKTRSQMLAQGRIDNEMEAKRIRSRDRNSYFMWKYGISLAQWTAMFEQQGGKCAICDSELDGSTHTHVDHNHTTDAVRDLLCSRCNHVVGHSKENVIILARTIEYLNRHSFTGDPINDDELAH